MTAQPLLDVNDLTVEFATRRGIVKAATENQMRDLRGREISMIFQNPRAALNPIRKVGDQIEDVLRQHVQSAASDRGEKAIEALEQV
ncbi:MAG TPA: hypothetical protein VK621_14770, partial [Bradyrhizobium sp.]|nr:hypothetical protein [Bradyrhizobium sp.]